MSRIRSKQVKQGRKKGELSKNKKQGRKERRNARN
jgi:hypothetical protein